MKQMHHWLISLAVVASAAVLPAHARDLEAIKKAGVIQLATEGAFAPFNYFLGTKLTGYEIDVAEAVAKKMGLQIEWKALAFDALISAVRQDRFDAAIASHGYTDERAKSVDFTSPHYCSGGQVVARSGGPKAVADLKDKIVVVQLATTYADAVGKIPGLKEVKTLPKDTDALSALMGQRADAWVTDKFVAKNSATKLGGGKLQLGEMVFTERISFILKKGNPELKAAMSQAIDALKADGTLANISKRWFDEDISACP
jgi:polar amino acid transport system substrate-binding protein